MCAWQSLHLQRCWVLGVNMCMEEASLRRVRGLTWARCSCDLL